jgi:hypothetical protein
MSQFAPSSILPQARLNSPGGVDIAICDAGGKAGQPPQTAAGLIASIFEVWSCQTRGVTA